MLAELFQAIVGVSQEARSKVFEVQDFPNDPDRRLLVVDGVEKVLETPRQPPDPQSIVLSIADLAAAYVRKFGDKTLEDAKATYPEVWYTIARAMFFQDEPYRRQNVVMNFRESAIWKTVRELKGPKIYQHAALIRLLRHDLAPCGVLSVLDAFRTMNYSVIENAKLTRNHGNQSMDADLVATAQAGGMQAPDQFLLDVKPFADEELNGLSVRVTVTIDIDAKNQAITLQLLPDEIEKVESAMRSWVLERLAGEMPSGVVLLAGTP